jgi:hypothetical protein
MRFAPPLHPDMTVTGIISAIVIGAIIGALARLILPGRQHSLLESWAFPPPPAAACDR